MKVPCQVIEDLLPLYHDNVCSNQSREIVEEHLVSCEVCRDMLEKLDEDTADVKICTDDASPIKAISHEWKKDKKKACLRGTIIAAAACALIFAGYTGLTKYKCIPVSSDVMEVSDVSQLSDGTIIYHLDIKDNKEIHWDKFTVKEDGSYYITPMRSVIEKKRSDDKGLGKDYFMVDIAENNAYQKNHGDGIVITSCYLGTEDDNILIWNQGMALPEASEELEKLIN
ncbi:MAG: zf-HC2 domain-containing protein [Oscillospiraceae bacterium]|nr:zf-HC2 domain-containing protein [Oscillospiraceae bacterium]